MWGSCYQRADKPWPDRRTHWVAELLQEELSSVKLCFRLWLDKIRQGQGHLKFFRAVEWYGVVMAHKNANRIPVCCPSHSSISFRTYQDSSSIIKPVAKRAIVLCDCLLHKASLSSSCVCCRAELVAAETWCKKKCQCRAVCDIYIYMYIYIYLIYVVSNCCKQAAPWSLHIQSVDPPGMHQLLPFSHEVQNCAILCKWKELPVSGTPGIKPYQTKHHIRLLVSWL